MHRYSAAEIPKLAHDALKELSINSPILGAAIFSVEGLPFASHFHSGMEDVAIAAMVASLYSAGEQTVQELRQGSVKSIIIQGDLGTTLVIAITRDYLLAVTAPENAKLGLIFNDAKKAARKLGNLIQEII